jgi:2-furoyl-CoA dehydrogenase large subunit
VSRPPTRDEDAALVAGAGRFVDDLDPLPGTLVAAVVRSPHARVRSADLRAARAHPGVAAVIGPEEVRAAVRPFPLSTTTPMPYLPSATDTARYVGEPVAVVVAVDRYVAEDAAELVEVDYEPLDVVVDTRRALEPDAPLLHPEAGTNVATDRSFSFGDVDGAFAAADHVVRGEYTFPRYSSVPMECYGVVAHWTDGADGPAVEAWANFHGPFTMVPVVAGALGVPVWLALPTVPHWPWGLAGDRTPWYPTMRLFRQEKPGDWDGVFARIAAAVAEMAKR